MLNLIVISATVLILVAMFLYVSVKRVVKTENGEVLVTKSIFSSKYKVKPEGGLVIPPIVTGFKVNTELKSRSVLVNSMCTNGSSLTISVKYAYGVNLHFDNFRGFIPSDESMYNTLDILIKNSVNKFISTCSLEYIATNMNQVISDITEDILLNSPEEIFLKSIEIDFSANYSKFNSVLNKPEYTEDSDPISQIEKAKKDAEEEIELKTISLEKTKKLNKIDLDIAKENTEKEVEMRGIEIQKNIRINKRRKELEAQEAESDLKRELQNETLKEENSIKIEEMKNKSKLKLMEEQKKIDLEKIESDKEINLKKLEAEKAISDASKNSEIDKINNESEIKRHLYKTEEDLHDEEVKKKGRELELEVILPAKAKSEAKKIDTNSSIESSKLKLNYKKEESEVLSQIKNQKDSADLKLYSDMINIAAGNSELAIKWKSIESEVEKTRIKSESISKLPLDKIIINGGDISSLSNITSIMDDNKGDEKKKK